jgi:Polysaccharide lyase
MSDSSFLRKTECCRSLIFLARRAATANRMTIFLAGITFGINACSLVPTKHETTFLPPNPHWEILSPGQPHNLQSVEDPLSKNSRAIRFELRKGEQWLNHGIGSYRTEISTGEFPPLASEKWYSFSLFLPEDFPIEDNRLVLAQWWSKTKKQLGEKPKSPSAAFRFRGGLLYLSIRHSSEQVVRNPDRVPEEIVFSTKDFILGRWHRFTVFAKWSFKTDGRIKVWLDGAEVANYSGPVGYNDDEGPVFKFGLYRDASEKTYVAYFKEIKIGNSRTEIENPR